MLRKLRDGVLLAIGLAALAGSPSATSQESKPMQTHGITLRAATTLPLGAQIPALNGYGLQIREVVLQPGAVAGYHSHAKRPVVAYLISGDYTEHRDGEGVVTHKPGEQWVEGPELSHWSENRGTEPAYLINVEVYRMK
jgi:quercetin dioxygenase-like cupin family protein